jgi:hypothetical protein
VTILGQEFAISTFNRFGAPLVEERLSRLRADLADGDWHRRFGQLLSRSSLDVGYRLITLRRR